MITEESKNEYSVRFETQEYHLDKETGDMRPDRVSIEERKYLLINQMTVRKKYEDHSISKVRNLEKKKARIRKIGRIKGIWTGLGGIFLAMLVYNLAGGYPTGQNHAIYSLVSIVIAAAGYFTGYLSYGAKEIEAIEKRIERMSEQCYQYRCLSDLYRLIESGRTDTIHLFSDSLIGFYLDDRSWLAPCRYTIVRSQTRALIFTDDTLIITSPDTIPVNMRPPMVRKNAAR